MNLIRQKRRVLVTGASKGIGRAVLRRLNQDGYRATGIARTSPGNLEPGEEFHACDLTNEESTHQLIEALAREHPFYGVVNNAGIGAIGSVENCTIQEMQDTFRVSVIGTLVCTQAALAGMKPLGEGRIINFSSRAALGIENRTAYSATKAGVIGLSRTWALELARHNITVNVIAPGLIETEGYREVNPPDHPRRVARLASVPLHRTGHPEEIAHAVAFLLHESSGFITGQTIHIDGGMTISAVRVG